MAVIVRVRTCRKEYVTSEITLSEKEYQRFKAELQEDGVSAAGDSLLEHPTVKHFDSFGSSEEVFLIEDTFENELYTS